MNGYCYSCKREQKVTWRQRRDRERPRCNICDDPLGPPPKERKPLRRRPPSDRHQTLRKVPLSSRPPDRIWTWARIKVEDEGACRFCGQELPPYMLHACHVVGRERDEFDPVTGEPQPQPWIVDPDRVVPGCEPCHTAYDEHKIDVLGKLTLEEELQAVFDCRYADHSGIEGARRRVAPSAYREAA